MRGILIYCFDYHCSHSTAIDADRWPDDIEPRSSAPLAASAAPTRGRISIGTQSQSVCWSTIETREMHDELVNGNGALWS